MSISYEISADKSQISDAIALFEFVGGNISNAERIAINKTLPKVKTRSSSLIREQVNLKAAYVNEKLSIVKASRNSVIGKITTPSRGVLLSHYATNITSFYNAPRVKVKPGASPKVVQGDSDTIPNKPFYMILQDSYAIGIVARRNKPGPRGGLIKSFYGPSISQVFRTVKDDVEEFASGEYVAQVLDAMRYILAKTYPPEG